MVNALQSERARERSLFTKCLCPRRRHSFQEWRKAELLNQLTRQSDMSDDEFALWGASPGVESSLSAFVSEAIGKQCIAHAIQAMTDANPRCTAQFCQWMG